MASVLIVDDSGFFRGRLRNILRKAGHTTAEAPDGIEALAKIGLNDFDCVFLDLIMPKADGFEVLLSLQKMEDTTPVIVLTSDTQLAARDQCLELGAIEFLNKPARPEAILEAVDAALSVTVGSRA